MTSPLALFLLKYIWGKIPWMLIISLIILVQLLFSSKLSPCDLDFFCARTRSEAISCKASYLHPPVQAFMNYRLLPRNKQSQLTKNESASSSHLNYNHNFQTWCRNYKSMLYYAETASKNTYFKEMFLFVTSLTFFSKLQLVC